MSSKFWRNSIIIIERVDGSTPWVPPLVLISKKNGVVHICLDMHTANKVITRECYSTPTIDDLIHTFKWSNSVFKIGSSIWISSNNVSPSIQIHHNVRNTPRSLEILQSEFWHKLSQ